MFFPTFPQGQPKVPATSRKRDVAEELLARVKAKGYQRGAHKDEDEVPKMVFRVHFGLLDESMTGAHSQSSRERFVLYMCL